jgi:GT2 family glycosyltransferase
VTRVPAKGAIGGAVSAVVVNYNGGDRVIRCVEALARQTHPLCGIVVVDNGSRDGSPDRIRERWSEVEVVVLPENPGLPTARNVGLREVTSDLVLLVDSDIYLEPDALERLVRAQEETGATVACPRIRLLPERDIVQADGAAPHFLGTMTLLQGYRPAAELGSERRTVPGCIGACYLLRRSEILEAGGFDETYFFYFEDLEFLLRLAARGHETVCEPGAVVFHDRGRGTPGLSFRGTGDYPLRRAYLSMRNRWLTMLIHYRARTLLLLAPALLVYEGAVVAFALKRGWGGQWWRAWVWTAKNRGEIARQRRTARCARVRPDREILTGGPIPLAPGLVRSRLLGGVVGVLSFVLDAYWRAVRPLVG